MREWEVLCEDDNERRAIVIVRASSAEEARARVRYMFDPTAARVIEARPAWQESSLERLLTR